MTSLEPNFHTALITSPPLEEEEKVVIFAHHRKVTDALQEAFADYGAVKLQGGMTDKAKDKAVRAFKDGDSRVFVGQIQAAGTGITLIAAKTVMFALNERVITVQPIIAKIAYLALGWVILCFVLGIIEHFIYPMFKNKKSKSKRR